MEKLHFVNDFEIERLKYSRVIGNNTDGDMTKINDVERFYDLTIVEQFEILENYHNNNNNKLRVEKNEECYKYIRLLFDDGG